MRECRLPFWQLTAAGMALSIGVLACARANGEPPSVNRFEQIIPQQMTRVFQTESYTQYLRFCNPVDTAADVDKVLRSELIATLFGTGPLPGGTFLPERYQPGTMSKGWHKKTFYIKGWMSISMIPYGYDQDMFIVDGRGKHVVYDERDHSAVVAKADFVLADDGPHKIQELVNGAITVRVLENNVLYDNSVAPPHPETQERPVFVKIYIRNIAADVFSIDYERSHLVGIVSKLLGLPNQIFPIGHIIFDPPASGYKLVDLRRRHEPWLADYSKILSETGHSPVRASHLTYTWVRPSHGCAP